ncbi:hydroxyethylthiazole kinase [Brotaphodocola catenula]|uniref:Hydroxyethylthiazole kinase n=1 Tax=Brotaphodocola catenula TaxID=2885361 RepID=A0AAE3DHC6_9FIRM|nr:hydroxyethylthiazole kinase [Brotaphodocola catenula]MCC2163710.1 hydroxyethylthiazole kinase [Brotaphodocola catenula]
MQLMKRMQEMRNYIRETQPLIHCITNPISIHDCANVILATGARPIMAEHPKEVEEITAVSSALMLNLGNITDVRMESMRLALAQANRDKIPVILDLVGVTCSHLRRRFAESLLEEGQFAVIKGNISEILAVASLPFHGTGIDAGAEDAISGENQSQRGEVAKSLAKTLGCAVLATGKKDLVAVSDQAFLVSNGDPALSGITGTGCMVGALTASYLPAVSTQSLRSSIGTKGTDSEYLVGDSCAEAESAFSEWALSALLGVVTMGIAGEKATKDSRGPGSFQTALLDEIFCLSEEEFARKARIYPL